jgi:hypothetical protein
VCTFTHAPCHAHAAHASTAAALTCCRAFTPLQFTYQLDVASEADDRSFEDASARRADGNARASTLTVEHAPMVFATLVALRPRTELCALPQPVRCSALQRLHGLAHVVAPLLEKRTAPAPPLRATGGGKDLHEPDMETAMWLGLLPTVVRPGADGDDIAEGLEPVYLAGGEVLWQAHVRWFRWFASGDVTLLFVLLLLREIS